MPTPIGDLPPRARPWTTFGALATVTHTARGVEGAGAGARLSVAVLAPNLIHVRMAPGGTFLPRRSWAVTPDDGDWPAVPITHRDTATAVEIETGALRVRIERDPCRLICYDPAGRPFAEDAGAGMAWRAGRVAGWKAIAEDEHFYGFGERSGLLDKRGARLTNWTVDAVDYTSLTDNMYQAIPFFLALRPQVGYGILFNTTFASRFDMGQTVPDLWQMETLGPELDYYILYGPTPAAILATLGDLTGRMPLPPRWALGYHQCRWSYFPESVVRDLAAQFRARHIPCDVIHLDIDYMSGFRVFTWSPIRFPDPARLVGDLAKDGFKTVAILDPGVKYDPDANYAPFDEGDREDYFVRHADGTLFHGYVWPDKAVFPDFLRPEVRDWWAAWQHTLTGVGVAGIWNDMNEPAVDDRPFNDGGVKITFPLDAPQGPPGEGGTHAETHNLYGWNMARASREGLDRLRPNERSFVLTRSGFAGIQRWSSVWLGDNNSTWDQLEQSLPMLCNIGLSGVAFVGVDIGGFAGNATPELFARWMQAGVLYPLMRGHSAMGTQPHEPWMFGPEVETISREYIELRYRLLPTLYTLFQEAAATGAPILRPLLYHYPDDPATTHLYDQVLLGPNLLAAPVVRPGVRERLVYLPEGVWYDWWTGAQHAGPARIIAPAPLDRLPLYVRAGAILPLGPVMQHTGERPLDELTVRVWPGEGAFTLYEDDGHSFAYRQGAWATTPFRVHTTGGETVVEIGPRTGSYTPPAREVIVAVEGADSQRFADDGSARRLVF